MNQHHKALEFDRIIEKLKEFALSEQAKEAFDRLSPYLNEDVLLRRTVETTAARDLIRGYGSPPLGAMEGLEEALRQCEMGAMPTPEQLNSVARFAMACRRMGSYLAPSPICGYGKGIEDLAQLRGEIERCVDEEAVRSEASSQLAHLRRLKEHMEGLIRERLNHILKSRQSYLADNYIAQRNGRFVLPVLRKFQGQFGGTVIEVSGKGSTVFMEPDAIGKLQGEMNALLIEEDSEIRRILYTLGAMTAERADAIRRNMQAMEALDVMFARGRLSLSMDARPADIGAERFMRIVQGRHPLLDREACVPLDFELSGGTTGVVITGPNTGGKTVALKTVGLLTLMAQCGLHIPCAEGSYIPMRDGFYVDVGDSQSLTQNLSTFSGHMTNVIDILSRASCDSLVLLDELGSGTDPAEGMGLAIAILSELTRRGLMYVATTHYALVKDYALQTPGVLSARMAFDRESLRPLYRLEMGKAGESCALDIAKRLGLAPELIARAHAVVYGGEVPNVPAVPIPKSALKRAPRVTAPTAFTVGDSVALPGGELGIVFLPADAKGDVIVQVRGEKRAVKHNRLALKTAAADLYPPDYDFSIVFDTIENRKARHLMERRYDPNAVVKER